LIDIEGYFCTDESPCTDPSSTGAPDPTVLAGMFTLSFLVGIISFFLGLIRVGFFVNIITKPTLNAFISASALIILGSQLKEYFGFCPNSQTCHPICLETAREGLPTFILALQQIFSGCVNWVTFAIAFSSTSLFFLFEFGKRFLVRRFSSPYFTLFPSIFIIVILGILVGWSCQNSLEKE
jgi:MFS superfamily sulfate permease-like transporter